MDDHYDDLSSTFWRISHILFFQNWNFHLKLSTEDTEPIWAEGTLPWFNHPENDGAKFIIEAGPWPGDHWSAQSRSADHACGDNGGDGDTRGSPEPVLISMESKTPPGPHQTPGHGPPRSGEIIPHPGSQRKSTSKSTGLELKENKKIQSFL